MNRKIILLLFIITIHMYPLISQTEEAGETSAVSEDTLLFEDTEEEIDNEFVSPSSFSFWDFARMILIFAFVIGVIYLVFFFLKKAGSPKFSGAKLIKLLSTQTLHGNKAIHIANVGKQYFLIGVSENNISLISELTDKETIDELMLKVSADETVKTGGKRFTDVLSTVFRKEGNMVNGDAQIGNSAGFLKKQRDRLKNI